MEGTSFPHRAYLVLCRVSSNGLLHQASGRTNLGQPPADGTGLLGAEVKGKVLLALVVLAQVRPLLLVHNSEHTRNALADSVAKVREN